MMEDKWPQRGDLYWYVNWPYGTASSIQVLTAVYDGFGVDKNREQVGNCYRTELEAKQAMSRILEVLKASSPCNTFPKLTATIFNRPDCPDWCNAAMVSSSGIAYWVDGDFETRCKEITGLRFDASDWQHSLIKRPVQ